MAYPRPRLQQEEERPETEITQDSFPFTRWRFLKVIGIQHPWHPPCHPSLTVLIGLDTLDVVGDIGRKLI